ncbi:MAG: dephospho-CoA kinase [Lachnospiraceae bacterium]
MSEKHGMMQNKKDDNKMKVIGVTGGVGSGKTTLLQEIQKKYSCKILLADVIANELKQKGQVCYNPLVKLLGNVVLDENAEIDKLKMAGLIFANEKLLEQVNEIVHPAVKEYILSEIDSVENQNQYEFLFVEAALLIEAGYKDYLETLWYIHARYDIRVARLQQGRGYSSQKIQSIVSKQLSEELYQNNSDIVIDNSGELSLTMMQIDGIIKQMR